MPSLVSLFRWMSACRNWWLVVLLRFGYARTPMVLKMVDDAEYRIDQSGHYTDVLILSEMYFTDAYFWDQIPAQLETVVDVGANIGIFSIYLHRHYEVGHTFLVEPHPKNLARLTENLRLNDLADVTEIVPVAISGESGDVDLYQNDSESGRHSMYASLAKTGDFVKVRSLSLHELVSTFHIGSIDLLKLDCEGAEYDILLNMTSDQLAPISRIVMEIHHLEGYDDTTLVRHLTECGYTIDRRGVMVLAVRR